MNAANREALKAKAHCAKSGTKQIHVDANFAAGRAWHRRLGFWRARAILFSGGGGDCAVGSMRNHGGGGDPAQGNGPGRGRGGGFNGVGHGGGFPGIGNGVGFNGTPPNNGGRGGGGYNNRFFGGGNNRQSNFVADESSGVADNSDGHGQGFPMEFGDDFGQFNRGSNYNSYNRNGGNYQYRPRNFGSNNFNAGNRNYNGGRVNHNKYRNSGGGNNGPVNPIDTNLADISP
jgi:hypothetical protein